MSVSFTDWLNAAPVDAEAQKFVCEAHQQQKDSHQAAGCFQPPQWDLMAVCFSNSFLLTRQKLFRDCFTMEM